MSKAERIEKKAMLIALGIIAVIEIALMIYDNETAVFMNTGVFLLCIPDTIISFIRKDETKWWDFWMLVLYFVLALISIGCNLIFA